MNPSLITAEGRVRKEEMPMPETLDARQFQARLQPFVFGNHFVLILHWSHRGVSLSPELRTERISAALVRAGVMVWPFSGASFLLAELRLRRPWLQQVLLRRLP